MSSDDELTLTSLPPDVIRKIITMGLQSINSARMISPRWNRMATDRSNLPSLTSLTWNLSSRQNKLTMLFPNGYASYFGEDNEKWSTSHSSYYSKAVTSRLNIFGQVWMHTFTRLFNRCSRIERLELDIDISKHSEKLDAVLAAVGRLPISTLVLSSGGALGFTEKDEIKILAMLRAHSIRELVLPFSMCREIVATPRLHLRQNCVYFWSAAVQYVESISIVEIVYRSFAQCLTDELNKTQTVAARMESRLLNNLTICYDIHLSASGRAI